MLFFSQNIMFSALLFVAHYCLLSISDNLSIKIYLKDLDIL